MPIPIDKLHRLLRCDADAGTLWWLERDPSLFPGMKDRLIKTWNTRYAGREAFTSFDANGYKRGNLLGRVELAHRAIWALHTGAWPDADIDHINGNRADNRIANLRQATRGQNMANSKSARGSSSRMLGVYYDKARNLWCAEITSGYKKKYLGRFSSEHEAAKAYDAAALELHGKFARLNFPTAQP